MTQAALQFDAHTLLLGLERADEKLDRIADAIRTGGR